MSVLHVCSSPEELRRRASSLSLTKLQLLWTKSMYLCKISIWTVCIYSGLKNTSRDSLTIYSACHIHFIPISLILHQVHFRSKRFDISAWPACQDTWVGGGGADYSELPVLLISEEMALLAYRILSLILFSSAVFVLCTSQGMYSNHWYIGLTSSLYFGFNVSSDQCVTPPLDYSKGGSGSDGNLYIYSMSPFTSCNGIIVGYKFCYENTISTTGVRVATVLLLEDVGVNYRTVRRFTVEAILGRDCLSGEQCCVCQNLSAENQFGVNSSYLYGVVDLPGNPNMRQTNVGNIGRLGDEFNGAAYTRDGDTALTKSGNPTLQPLRIFQFIIGEFGFTFAHVLINQIVSSLVFQKIALLM